MQEDTSLVQQTLEGDGQAFHRLIMKYYTAIYALIMSWVKNTEDAKDLTQETFLKAYQELASLKHPEQFRVWLRQIAKHQCQNWLRKKQELFIPLDEDMISKTPSADEVLILRETLAKVMKAIDELPEMESQLLKERYIDDVSYDELEAKHGLSHSVLAMRLLRARQHVREKIKLLSGVFALSWQDVTKKIFVGGVVAVKMGVKTKLIITGIAVIMVFGGTGVFHVWRSHQSAMEQSESLMNPVTQNVSQRTSAKLMYAKNDTEGKHIDQEMEKPQNNEANKAKTDNTSNPAAKASAIAIPQTRQQEETLMDRYNRIVNSPEYIQDRDREGEIFAGESGYYTQQSEKLRQEKILLEDKLAKASKEEQDQIQKELEDAKSKYKEARVNMFQNLMLTMEAYDRATLKHFKVDELGEIFKQKGYQISHGSPLPGVGKEDMEFVSEAKGRLKEKGFIPNPWTAVLLSW